jgi:hypothetical protein
VKAGFTGADWIQVMCAHNQYSSMSVVGDSQSIVYGDLRDPLFQKLMQKIETIMQEQSQTSQMALCIMPILRMSLQDGLRLRFWASPTSIPELHQLESRLFKITEYLWIRLQHSHLTECEQTNKSHDHRYNRKPQRVGDGYYYCQYVEDQKYYDHW